MLEQYFLKPDTVDQIRGSWLGEPIERYVIWLSSQNYAPAYIRSRVPILKRFARFVWSRGGRTFEDLPEHIEPFVSHWVAPRETGRNAERIRDMSNALRGPVEQFVSLLVPSFVGRGRPPVIHDPFPTAAPGFFTYLREERGLRETSVSHYRHSLRFFEAYLNRIGVRRLAELSPAILSAFVTEAGQGRSKSAMKGMCSAVRVLVRYAYRERLIGRDLSAAIEIPRTYRSSSVPRSITWDEVRLMLESVDRRGAVGKRDYAILVLLVTYGLRAREVAALTLDDIDWERERLLVPERKAGHCTAYPLSATVGEAFAPNPRCRKSPRCPGRRPIHHRVPSALATALPALGARRAPAGIRTNSRESLARTPAPSPSAPRVGESCPPALECQSGASYSSPASRDVPGVPPAPDTART